MSAKTNEQEIINYYDHAQVDYEWVWHLKTRMSMHYGYWDDTTKKLRQSLTNMNVQAAAFADIKVGSHVLDAGCGVGGSSIFLAKTFNCTTMGISLSEKQIQTCHANAVNHSVNNQCTFEVGNYLKTRFDDNTFDLIWAMESVCHALNKADFLREAFRILKPGGRILVADFFSSGVNSGTSNAVLMEKWANSWAIESYADEAEFWSDLKLSGFINCKKKDVTPHVIRSIKRLYKGFFIALPITYVLQLIGLRNKTQTANVWSTFYQYQAHKKNLWKYMFFCVQKPSDADAKVA